MPRCPKGYRKNKQGDCVKTKKSPSPVVKDNPADDILEPPVADGKRRLPKSIANHKDGVLLAPITRKRKVKVISPPKSPHKTVRNRGNKYNYVVLNDTLENTESATSQLKGRKISFKIVHNIPSVAYLDSMNIDDFAPEMNVHIYIYQNSNENTLLSYQKQTIAGSYSDGSFELKTFKEHNTASPPTNLPFGYRTFCFFHTEDSTKRPSVSRLQKSIDLALSDTIFSDGGSEIMDKVE